jgi:hypothetical protein
MFSLKNLPEKVRPAGSHNRPQSLRWIEDRPEPGYRMTEVDGAWWFAVSLDTGRCIVRDKNSSKEEEFVNFAAALEAYYLEEA